MTEWKQEIGRRRANLKLEPVREAALKSPEPGESWMLEPNVIMSDVRETIQKK